MRKITILCLLLACALPVFAGTYRPEQIPNVQRMDGSRYVSDPDGILSPAAVAHIDSVCASLRERGLAQVAVVAVDDIAGGDPFSFAVDLFRSWGVGSAKSDNGLGILLVKGNEMGMTKAEFTALAAALFMCYDPLKRLGVTLTNLKSAYASLERINYILKEPDTMPEPSDPVPLGRAAGRLDYDHVSFSYDGARHVLNGIDIHIRPGEVVGLVGPSGAGKTTFASLLPRFYDVSSGAVLVDGVDVRAATLHDVRKNIAFVSQHPVLFHGTIMENIRLGRQDATDEEVIAAARSASADEFIMGMPEGYQTVLGDGGSGLSGGQRQRVAIARAFLKDAPILILDEATASLDAESEAQIQHELDRLVEGRTALIVAHRFSSIRVATRILVFEDGRIVGDGTHEQLYASCPLYRELYDRQSL